MNKREQKNLIRKLTDKIKNTTYEDLKIKNNPLHKRKQILDKYVSIDDYKQLVGFYKFLKSFNEIDYVVIENLIDSNKKFTFLKKCQQSIYQFTQTLYCFGPQYVAQEMSRQGKEVEYINNEFNENE